MSVVVFLGWYYPIGLRQNAVEAGQVAERGVLMFLFILTFLIFAGTFTNMVIAGIETAEAAGNITNLLFSLSLICCGYVKSSPPKHPPSSSLPSHPSLHIPLHISSFTFAFTFFSSHISLHLLLFTSILAFSLFLHFFLHILLFTFFSSRSPRHTSFFIFPFHIIFFTFFSSRFFLHISFFAFFLSHFFPHIHLFNSSIISEGTYTNTALQRLSNNHRSPRLLDIHVSRLPLHIPSFRHAIRRSRQRAYLLLQRRIAAFPAPRALHLHHLSCALHRSAWRLPHT